MVLVPAGDASAVCNVVGHAAYEVDTGGEAGRDEIAPDGGAPACYFCDAVTKWHCDDMLVRFR